MKLGVSYPNQQLGANSFVRVWQTSPCNGIKYRATSEIRGTDRGWVISRNATPKQPPSDGRKQTTRQRL